MQHPAFAVGPGDHMAEPVAPLFHLTLGVEQQVHRDAVMGELAPEPAQGVEAAVLRQPAVVCRDQQVDVGLRASFASGMGAKQTHLSPRDLLLDLGGHLLQQAFAATG